MDLSLLILTQMRTILRAKVARKMFLLFVWPWTICGLAYYGIFLSVRLVNVDKYTLTAITVSIELFVLLAVVVPINKVSYSETRLGDFLKLLGTIFRLKVAQLFCDLRAILKRVTFYVKLAVATFWATWGNFGLLVIVFIPISDFTGQLSRGAPI